MKIARTLIAAASLAVLAAAPAAAQHHGGGGGYHGGGYGHGGYRGGYGYGWGWGGGYGYYGYGDAFAFGLLGGYALGAGPWGYDSYYYDAPPPPPPAYGVYDRAPPADFDDRASVGSQQAPLDDGRHCPLIWDKATGRYEPRCQ